VTDWLRDNWLVVALVIVGVIVLAMGWHEIATALAAGAALETVRRTRRDTHRARVEAGEAIEEAEAEHDRAVAEAEAERERRHEEADAQPPSSSAEEALAALREEIDA